MRRQWFAHSLLFRSPHPPPRTATKHRWMNDGVIFCPSILNLYLSCLYMWWYNTDLFLLLFLLLLLLFAMLPPLLSMSNIFKAYRHRDIKLNISVIHSHRWFGRGFCLKSSQPGAVSQKILLWLIACTSSLTNKCGAEKNRQENERVNWGRDGWWETERCAQ